MKKIAYILAGLALLGQTSCSDMLDTDSDNQLYDPEFDQKTDSVFVAFGVMSAMQQLGDIYVLQNELRGDLVNTTNVTNNNLRYLFNYSSNSSAYDSAYVYYKVINNVNYYLAHRDTTLFEGSTNLVIHEYAAMKAFRAWAYLQAVRQYGEVKYVTKPLTSISDVENDASPMLGIEGICTNLINDLLPYSGYSVPDHADVITLGGGNNSYTSSTMSVSSVQSYIPVDVILGELYLELAAATNSQADYLNAAKYYYTYINNNPDKMYVNNLSAGTGYFDGGVDQPSDWSWSTTNEPSNNSPGGWFSSSFSNTSSEIISQIPFAQNYLDGTTTALPSFYGVNYYTAEDDSILTPSTIQLVPSPVMNDIANSTDVYYYSSFGTNTVASVQASDCRRWDCFYNRFYSASGGSTSSITDSLYMSKFNGVNIVLYRVSTVWLHLAEALNGAGYPDAAFAILRSGLRPSLLTSNDTTYIKAETEELLTTDIPFCSTLQENYTTWEYNVGIHSYGASYGASPLRAEGAYEYETVISERLAKIAEDYNVTVGTTLADTINAVEDILCDEYAMEFAFEGTRFSDLTRMARHKNNAMTSYGANFGGTWLEAKMYYKTNKENSLKDEENWYLPFK